jgi:hypothetical protein
MISPPFVFCRVQAVQSSEISEDIQTTDGALLPSAKTLAESSVEPSFRTRFQIDAAEIESLYWRGS